MLRGSLLKILQNYYQNTDNLCIMYIEIKHIKKNFSRKKVLTDISLQVPPGSCVGILGSNGSGKSTLLSILAGVQGRESGQFLYNDKDLFQNNALRSEIVAYVPQGNPLIGELTAWDNLLLWYDKKTLKAELTDGVLNILGISEFIKVPVDKMSGGMRKRLSIGCAIAGQPKILLLDEPSSALDLICKEHIYNYLKKFKAEGGSILLATHDAQELDLCDKWYILRNGLLTPYNYAGDIHDLAAQL